MEPYECKKEDFSSEEAFVLFSWETHSRKGSLSKLDGCPYVPKNIFRQQQGYPTLSYEPDVQRNLKDVGSFSREHLESQTIFRWDVQSDASGDNPLFELLALKEKWLLAPTCKGHFLDGLLKNIDLVKEEDLQYEEVARTTYNSLTTEQLVLVENCRIDFEGKTYEIKTPVLLRKQKLLIYPVDCEDHADMINLALYQCDTFINDQGGWQAQKWEDEYQVLNAAYLRTFGQLTPQIALQKVLEGYPLALFEDELEGHSFGVTFHRNEKHQTLSFAVQ